VSQILLHFNLEPLDMHIIFVGESGVLAERSKTGQIGTKSIRQGLLALAVQHLSLCVYGQ
jgi:hypothetical protein